MIILIFIFVKLIMDLFMMISSLVN